MCSVSITTNILCARALQLSSHPGVYPAGVMSARRLSWVTAPPELADGLTRQLSPSLAALHVKAQAGRVLDSNPHFVAGATPRTRQRTVERHVEAAKNVEQFAAAIQLDRVSAVARQQAIDDGIVLAEFAAEGVELAATTSAKDGINLTFRGASALSAVHDTIWKVDQDLVPRRQSISKRLRAT